MDFDLDSQILGNDGGSSSRTTIELETQEASGAAPEDAVSRLAYVRKLLVRFDARGSALA